MTAVYFALAANLCFSIAIVLYTQMSFKTSVLWMNTVKGSVAFVCFTLTVSLFFGWHDVAPISVACFFASGCLGLAIGDLFLLKAFTLIGPARTMVLFGFQPLLMAAFAWAIFAQEFPTQKLIAILFLIACLFTFSLERFRANKEWGMKGICIAFAGMFLDAMGILLTRYAFDSSENLHAFEGNAYRCLGALMGFFFYCPVYSASAVSAFFRKTLYKRAPGDFDCIDPWHILVTGLLLASHQDRPLGFNYWGLDYGPDV
jgi:drug/metabolite transporter (DMT)-like permease